MVEVFDLHQAEHKTIRSPLNPWFGGGLEGNYPNGFLQKSQIFVGVTSRGGAVVARRAHNPKVVGSNPTPATKMIKAEQ
jgi:hypothetical protein